MSSITAWGTQQTSGTGTAETAPFQIAVAQCLWTQVEGRLEPQASGVAQAGWLAPALALVSKAATEVRMAKPAHRRLPVISRLLTPCSSLQSGMELVSAISS